MATSGPQGTDNPALALGLPGAMVLLIGVGTHVDGARLPDVPAARTTVTELGDVFVQRCGLDRDRLRMVLDPHDPFELGRALDEAVQACDDVLLVYYVGHGLLDPDGGLYLATQATDDPIRGLAYRAFPFTALRGALADCRARSIVVVLDCCFSGRADAPLSRAMVDSFDRGYVGGGYVLASAAPESVALAPPNARYTAFSGEVLRLLREGDPTAAPELTLDRLYESLWRTLPERGFPRPHRRSADRAGELILAVNPAYRPLVIERRTVPPHDGHQTQGAPYRGLAAFQAEDAPYFFGREHATENLMRHVETRIRDGGPLVVVGPSGVGKSSLLRAGLLPALGRGLPSLPEVRHWPPMVFVPGPHPLGELAQRIARVSNQPADVIRARLADDPARVPEVLRTALAYQAFRGILPASGVRCVLVVDQFEALFTTCADVGERTAFIRALVAACEPAGDSPAVVVLSVRADFYGQCSACPELVPALQDGQVVIGPMTTAELRDAIEKPAHSSGLALEPGLSDLLLRDAFTVGEAKNAGVLPLLSHALLATWQQREGRQLTLSGYQATGGIWQALARTADDTYGRLDPAGRQIARNLLLRMVRIGDGTDDTRRRVPLADLMPVDGSDQVAVVLNSFAEARLITLDAHTAEITHDAVLHAWPLLREWIDTDRAGLLLAQRLREAAEAWDRERRDPAALYRGVRLDTARQWAEDPRHQTDLTPTAHQFLDASTAVEVEEHRAARRRTNRLRTLVAILAAFFLVAAGTSVIAIDQTSAATRQRDLVASRLAAQASSTVRATNPALAMQLALAAYRLAPTSDAASSLDSSAVVPFDTVPPGQHGHSVNVAYSPDGRLLAGYSDDHTLRLWDVTNPYQPHIDAVIPQVGGTNSAFSPNSRFLVAGGPGDTLRLWDVSDPRHPVADAVLATKAELPLYGVAVSPDGHTVAATGTGTLHLWDVTDPRHPLSDADLTFSKADQFGCSFSADGRVLATAGSATNGVTDLTVRLWDLTDIRHPALDYASTAGANTGFHAVAFSGHGRLLAAGGTDVELWDATDPKHPKVLSQDGSLDGNATALAFSPDGRTLAVEASVTAPASLSLVDVTNPDDKYFRPFSTSPLPTISLSMAFSPDGATLATSGDIVRLWHTPEPVLPAGAGDGQWDVTDGALAAARPTTDELPNGSIGLWNVIDARHVRRAGTVDGPLASQLGLPNRRVLITYSDATNAVQLWDVGKPSHPIVASTIDLHTSTSSGIATGPGGLLVAADTDNTMGLWNVTNPYRPVMMATFSEPGKPLFVEISPDGHLVLVVDDRDVRIWSIADPRHPVRLGSFADAAHQYYTMAADPRFHLLVQQANLTLDTDVSVKLWNITNPRHPVAGATLSTTAENIALSPDGRTLAVSDAVNDTTTLWDVTDPGDPRKLSTITTPKPADLMVFSPNGTMLVTGNTQSNSAQLWDVHDPNAPTQRSTVTLPDSSGGGLSDDIQSVGFGSSDQTAVISGQDNLVLLDADPDRLRDYLCSLAGDTITPSQWQQYLPGVPYQAPCG